MKQTGGTEDDNCMRSYKVAHEEIAKNGWEETK